VREGLMNRRPYPTARMPQRNKTGFKLRNLLERIGKLVVLVEQVKRHVVAVVDEFVFSYPAECRHVKIPC